MLIYLGFLFIVQTLAVEANAELHVRGGKVILDAHTHSQEKKEKKKLAQAAMVSLT